MNSVSILGSRVSLTTVPDIAAAFDSWIAARDSRMRRVVVTGFHGLWEAHCDPEFRRILNDADLWVSDGVAPIAIARLKRVPGARSARRTPGAEIMQAYFELADRKGYSSFFYGDTDATLSELRRQVEKRYPKHRVAGVYSPPFRPLSPEEDAAIVQTIHAAKPDVLWVGLGLPKQDRWIHEHKDALKIPVAVGVGAAFAFVAGTVKRCPEWIGRCGFEWLYRFCREPKKLWRRDLIQGPAFLWHAGLELAGIRKYE